MPQYDPPASPAPVALWPCAQQPTRQHSTGTVVTRGLADRLLTTYTRPGDLVLHTIPSHRVAPLWRAAQTLNRRLATLDPTHPPIDLPAWHPARLLVTTGTLIPDGPVAPPDHRLLRAAPWLLTPGGLVAVVLSRPHHPTTAEPDPVTATVERAVRAGLGYLQHVIALRTPVRDGQLLPTHTARRPADGAQSVPVHTDLLVFTTQTNPVNVTGAAGD